MKFLFVVAVIFFSCNSHTAPQTVANHAQAIRQVDTIILQSDSAIWDFLHGIDVKVGSIYIFPGDKLFKKYQKDAYGKVCSF